MPQATQAPAAPAAKAPSAPAGVAPNAVQSTTILVPQTQVDVDVLLDRRSELSTQLGSASGRRNELSRQLRNAQPGPDRTGIESRITQLDGRIISIEQEMADVGRALSAAPSGLKQTTTSTGVPHPYGQPSASQITALGVVGTIFVLAPVAIGLTIRMLRRTPMAVSPPIPKEVVDRLERMEQGIEAVAVEVERIGEGQRFVTQLMSDRAQRAALPEGIPRS
jgi:hypothetical protein